MTTSSSTNDDSRPPTESSSNDDYPHLPPSEFDTVNCLTLHLKTHSHPLHGTSNDNTRTYPNPLSLWDDQLTMSKSSWYQKAVSYWSHDVDPTIDGMLGGYASISPCDIDASREFLETIIKNRTTTTTTTTTTTMKLERCCDCGAGIGRVSRSLLLPMGFEKCDLVEASAALIGEAAEFMGDEWGDKCRFFCTGLQDFRPRDAFYDLVWVQWVIGYLTDDDAVSFFRRCGESLREGGLVVIKDNCCGEDQAFSVDLDDGFVNRSWEYVRGLILLSGLKIVKEEVQDDFPGEIFSVPMIACEYEKNDEPKRST